DLRREAHLVTIGSPVARRRAGYVAGREKRVRALEHRHVREPHARAETGTATHAEQMPEEAKACHVRHRVYCGERGEAGAGAVQPGGRLDQLPITRIVECSLLQSRGE